MIQGGGMGARMDEKDTREPVQNEADNGLKNERGTLAMARTRDPHSATAQFFINLVDNDFLDHSQPTLDGWGYCVFGKSPKAWTWWTRSPRSRPRAWACTRMCPWTWC